jgi:hypothetical protein
MQRAQEGGAAAAIQAVLALKLAADRAVHLRRHARVAAAEATLPHDSLVTVCLLDDVVVAHLVLAIADTAADTTPQPPGEEQAVDQRIVALFATGGPALAPSQRALQILLARSRAGSLLALSPQEAAFFQQERWASELPGADLYLMCVAHAALYWPLPRSEAFGHGMHGALLAALSLQARCCRIKPKTSIALHTVLEHGLAEHDEMLGDARTSCGLSHAEDAALRHMRQRHCPPENRDAWTRAKCLTAASIQARAAAEVARSGLRRCALPSCGAMEARPKAFKLCSRCRDAAYCGGAHCAEDWRRHKREDGCTKRDSG